MARNGVWELQTVLLRYCASSGSSRGVREFVEKDLAKFAAKNPQIQFRTKIQGGHPALYGNYVTGYERQNTLKNMSPEQVLEVFNYMRNTLGRKVPTHNAIGIGVVERKNISIQGIWRNSPDLKFDELPEEIERREARQEEYGLRKMTEELGMHGIIRITEKLLERQRLAKEAALAARPVVEKVRATE